MPVSVKNIQEYYGKTLQSTRDLKTNACCSVDNMPDYLKPLLKEIEPEVTERFYGCGAPIPLAIEGCTVLDIGCGTGRDAYLAARLAGPKGRVIGLDMTEEQLEVANRNLAPQMDRFGFPNPTVTFIEGRMENLNEAGVADESVDVVISDCVINLSLDKEQVFREIFRVLKPGGELYFSDIFADRRLPAALMDDPVLHGECLAGAMYTEDFRRFMADLGCPDVRTISARPVTIDNAKIEAKIGFARFESRTVRAFKLAHLEDRCEDYGQVARYRGTIRQSPHRFPLDDHHVFEAGKPMLVCGNTASMVEETRLADHFEMTGDRSQHFGLFDCDAPAAHSPDEAGGCC